MDGTFPDDDDDGIIEATDGTYDDDDFTSAININHKLTFRISGDDAELFEVDKATGAIDFMDSPDYEELAERRYTITLTAHDPTDQTDSITIILDVQNIDEDPTFVEPVATDDFDENSMDPVATFTANDPEGVDDYSWGLTGTDAALFDLSVITGRLTFRSAPNFEAPNDDADGTSDGVYDVVVHLLLDGETVADEDDNPTPDTRTQAVAITVVDVDEDPVFTKTTDDNDNVVPTPLNIAENKQPNTDLNRPVESSPQASDEDEIPEDDMYASVALLYKLSGSGAEAFSIVPATGELRTTRVLDYESGDRSFEVTVTATDPTHSSDNDSSDSIDLVINVTDEDEAPVGGGTNQAPQFASSTMTRSVAENTDAEMDFDVRVTATDDDDNTITYTLDGTDAGHFDIDAATGQLMTSGALDYESKSSYTVTVTATDDDPTKPLSSMTTVTIMVTNEEETGSVDLSATSPVVGSQVAATLTDPDGSISGLTWDWHTSTDQVTWNAATGTETNDPATFSSTYATVADDVDKYLRATASYTDGYGSGNSAQSSGSAKVVATAVNLAPSFVADVATRSIAENTAAGAPIGLPVTAVDPNGADDTLTYTLEGTDAASFSIVRTTGQLRTLAALDYEDKDTYTVVVRATDTGLLSDTITVTINVIDVVDEEVPMTVQDYDPNGNGIDIDELFNAIDDYFANGISISLLFEVIDAYFANSG